MFRIKKSLILYPVVADQFLNEETTNQLKPLLPCAWLCPASLGFKMISDYLRER